VECHHEFVFVPLCLAYFEIFGMAFVVGSFESKMESIPMKSTDKPMEFERFSRFVRGIVNVPHSEIKRKLDAEQKSREKKKRAKTSPAVRASSDSSGR